MGTFTMRVEDDLKKDAASVCESYGLDLSTATRAFWMQAVRTKSLPLYFHDAEPNETSMQAIHETDALIEQGGDGYSSVQDLIESLEA